MLDTREYRTRTIFSERDNRKIQGIWPVGLDIGYSGVKCFCGNAIVCFPAYASVSSAESRISIANTGDDPRFIQYRGEDGIIWDVGAAAQDQILASDTSAGSLSIYGRTRYYSPMFRVLLRVGLACAMRTNQFGGPGEKKIKIQTGLPSKYMVSDKPSLLDAFAGDHEFSVRFGHGKWENFSFTLKTEDIAVMDQPEGTLFSISTDPNMRLMPDAARYFSSRLLIVDPGFGTMDMFPVIRKSICRDDCQTFPELGMKQVLKDTADEILKRYHFEVSVPAFQQYLETGTVIKKEGRRYSKVGFSDILEEHSQRICRRSVERMMDIYDPPKNFDYLVLTGGTGEAWREMFLRDEDVRCWGTVQILMGNQGDPSLPFLLSNARGYFIYAVSRFAKRG